MLNSYSFKNGDIKVSNNLKINACSGGIYKTYPETWFKRFNLDSVLAKELFRKENCYYIVKDNEFTTYGWEKNAEEVMILQMVICGDMEVIAELILKKDFEKNLNPCEKEEVINNENNENK